MSDFYLRPSSIEAASASIVAKKICKPTLLKDPIFGIYLKVNCDRDGEAEILSCLDTSDKKKFYNENSNRGLGDKIKGEKYFVMIFGGIKEVNTHKTAFSGRHNTNRSQTSSHTYAELIQGFKHIEDAEAKRQLQLKEQQNFTQ
jgi:hypothetical protein